MDVQHDGALHVQRQAGPQAQGAYAVVERLHVGSVAREPSGPPALRIKQVQRGVERRQGLRRWGEAVAAGAGPQAVLVDVGQVQRPACRPARAGQQAVHPRHGERGAGQALDALVGGERYAVHHRQRPQVQRQRTEGRHGIDDHPAPGASGHRRQGGHVMADAGRGFAVDQGGMGDAGVGQQRGFQRSRAGAFAVRDGQGDDMAPGLGRQAEQSVGVVARHRQQHAPAGRHEGAERGFHREVATALQRQRGMLAGPAAGDGQHTVADAGHQGAELVVPRRIVPGARGAHGGMRGDGTGDEQEHGGA